MTPLHVLSAGAAKGLVLALEKPFAAAEDAQFHCSFGAVGAIREQMLGGSACDLVILTQAVIDALAADGRVDSASRAAIGRVYTGVAVPVGEAAPDVGSADGLRAALLAARGIYLPDPERATAGIHFVKVLQALGIHDAVKARLRPFPNGAVAMRTMADAGEPGLIGCTQVTEINYTPGVTLVGVLPREFELATVYALAVATSAAQPGLAARFAARMTGPESAQLRRDGGFVID